MGREEVPSSACSSRLHRKDKGTFRDSFNGEKVLQVTGMPLEIQVRNQHLPQLFLFKECNFSPGAENKPGGGKKYIYIIPKIK